MSTKYFDVFYKKKGDGKVTYCGAGWEGKFADDQRSKGMEPWIDLNLSTVDADGQRHYATEIRFGKKVLKLGPEAGVFLKVGLCNGFTVADAVDETEVDDIPFGKPEDDDLAIEEL